MKNWYSYIEKCWIPMWILNFVSGKNDNSKFLFIHTVVLCMLPFVVQKSRHTVYKLGQ